MGKYERPVFEEEVDTRFGPEPPEGWHRGIPGLRIMKNPADHTEAIARSERYRQIDWSGDEE